MGDFRPASLFVSYSHLDGAVIKPLIDLNQEFKVAAWLDYLHTIPGGAWEEQHKIAIKTCYRLVLLWTRHSAASPQVEREWRWAIECGTPVVPVMLDSTPLPQDLRHLHGVSLQPYVKGRSGRLTLGYYLPFEWLGLGALAEALGAMAVALVLLLLSGLCIYWFVFSPTIGKVISAACLFFVGSLAIFVLLVFGNAINRYRLRAHLSRLVIQSLKEWGNENRSTSQAPRNDA
ncbi:MAG: toll/interleukin-1 receptor domain-containing protein [Candidatus Accumulibacter phosphatis]|uniref:toll/interleukin-1 receptor domain-containing protein n=1 Tax=Candidatus Accumulibacter phosphatis TaxID=327160 RepID=UPI001A540C1B|nr:toll/interleukin-1 receptor domain-containing protein [Candidatus Accumulibacter phosphatis]